MRLPSRESLLSDLQREKHNHHATYMVLQALINRGEGCSQVTHVVGKMGYSAKVVDPLSPTGGWVGIIWVHPNQRPTITCFHYEDWISDVSNQRRSIGGSHDELTAAYYDLAVKVEHVVWEARRVNHGESQSHSHTQV